MPKGSYLNKMRFNQKKDSGVAGLTILLSVIVMLFIIGLLVMIFALMGAELQTASEYTNTVSANETLTIDGTGISSAIVSTSQCGYASWTPTAVYNCTAGCTGATNEPLAVTTDYTVNADGTLTNVTFIETPLLVTYTYVDGGEACDVINDTTVAIANVTDWFAIFIVITAMVVLILLTVIIITAIKGSGMMMGEGTG